MPPRERIAASHPIMGQPEELDKAELSALLAKLRAHSKDRFEKLGVTSSHQLAAQYCLAYTCGEPLTAWEVMVGPGFFVKRPTDFLGRHYDEVATALTPKLTFELLRDHAVVDGQRVVLLDPDGRGWRAVHASHVNWFGAGNTGHRSTLTRTINRSDEWKLQRDTKQVEYCTKRAASDPSPRNLSELKSAKERLEARKRRDPALLEREALHRESMKQLVAEIDNRDTSNANFVETLAGLIRAAENEVRAKYGIAAVGEGWVSETELFHRIRELLPDIEAVHHGQPRWLGRQHLDIWIPSLSVAVEYHGARCAAFSARRVLRWRRSVPGQSGARRAKARALRGQQRPPDRNILESSLHRRCAAYGTTSRPA
jgi:hypothetical protein